MRDLRDQLVVPAMKELVLQPCLYMVEDTCCELSHSLIMCVLKRWLSIFVVPNRRGSKNQYLIQ